MIQKGKNIVPVEVKAEENLRAKSLKMYCQKYEPEYAVRISMSDYREEEWLTNRQRISFVSIVKGEGKKYGLSTVDDEKK